jgi:hypothetical protein
MKDDNPNKNNYRTLKIIALLVTVTIIATVGGYVITYDNLVTASNAVAKSFQYSPSEFKVTNFTQSPLSEDIEYIQVVDNPTSTAFTIILDAELYANDHYVDNIHYEKEIKANTQTTLTIPIHFGSSVLEEIMGEQNVNLQLKGQRTVTTKLLGIIPVTIHQNIP